MIPEPFRIEPTFSPRIWGARSLAPFYPDRASLDEPIGEAWLTDRNCRIASGPFAGKSLAEAWRVMPADWRGSRLANTPDFPLLVKFLFPTDKLSIQVHPDDSYAAAHEASAGGRGKTEMWHILSAVPGAKVFAGLKPGTTKEKFLSALHAHTLEDLFLAWPVIPGDTIFLPARTPHTIGPGMVICEVQQYSDITYRFYDYGRLDDHGKPRELHLQKALDVIDFGASSGGKIPPVPLPAQHAQGTLLAACPYFAAERWDMKNNLQTKSSSDHFELFIILEGAGYLDWQGSPLKYQRGECWLIPAALGKFSVHSEQPTSHIKTYIPDLSFLRETLQRNGIAQTQLSTLIFNPPEL